MATLLTQKYRWKTRRNAGIEFSLDYLVELFANQECSDPRDRVYGLLSLVDTFEPLTWNVVSADYNKSAKDVYIDVINAVQWSPRLASTQTRKRFEGILMSALQLQDPTLPSLEEISNKSEDVDYDNWVDFSAD
jgi:hypothetical protein